MSATDAAQREWPSMVIVGRIVRPHGNRGHVVVQPETDFADERFRPGVALACRTGSQVRSLRVVASREHDGRWIVGFDGVETIDAAEALRDAELGVPADALHALEPGRFYAHDLAGCEVRMTTGERIGRVDRVEFGTGVPLLVVKTDTGSEVLVPFVDAICRHVDVAAREIAIDPPAGLIDLNRGA